MLLLIKGNALPHIYLHCRFTTVKWSLVERFENKDRIYLNKNALPSLRSNCKNIFFWNLGHDSRMVLAADSDSRPNQSRAGTRTNSSYDSTVCHRLI